MGPRTVCLRNSVPTHCFLSSSHAEVSSHCLSIAFQLLSCCCSWFKVRFPTWKSGIIIVQQSKDAGLGVYGSSPRGSKVQPRLRIMGGRKGCRLSILALGQSSKALRFGALSPPISQVSMETEARKEEEGGGVVMKPPASQAWSGGENQISERRPGLFPRGCSHLRSCSLEVGPTLLCLSCSSVPTPTALFSPGSLPSSRFGLCCQSGSSNAP